MAHSGLRLCLELGQASGVLIKMYTEKVQKLEQLPESQKLGFVTYFTKKEIDLFEGSGALVMKEWMRRYNLTRDEAITLGYYLHHLNLSPEDIINRRILDVGSGSGEFKSSLSKVVGEANVVNFDDGKVWAGFMDVQGKSENLPFRDEVFDVALAHCSVPIMQATVAKRLDLIPATLKEMIRVVKSGGGKVTIYPIAVRGPSSHFGYQQMGEAVVRTLKEIKVDDPHIEIVITTIEDREDQDDLLEILRSG